VGVLDRGGLAVGDRPAGVLQAPADVGVAAGAQSLLEAAQLLERGAADQQVGGDAVGQVGVAHVRGLAQVAARARVASH
jgi:hypothetical protein